jgi:hypothetical protein
METGQPIDLPLRRHTVIERRLGWLLFLGLTSALLYAFIAARYPLAAGLGEPRSTWYMLSGRSPLLGLAHAGIYALLVLCYALALWFALPSTERGASRVERTGLPTLSTQSSVPLAIVIVWLLGSAALLGAYPGGSLDIFDYLFRGRMLAEFGASPLVHTPNEFRGQPFVEYISWYSQVDPYGPVWEYLSGGVARLAGSTQRLEDYLLGYRLLAIGMSGLCGALIYAMVRRHAPTYATAALLAWLWNPLQIVSTALEAHNEAPMLAGCLAALMLFQRRRWLWGLLALGLAAHIKITALLLLPAMGLWMARRLGWPRALATSAAALGLVLPLSWLLYAPLGGWATLPHMLSSRSRLLIDSPADLLYRALQEQWHWPEFEAWRLASLAAMLLFLAVAAVVLARFWRATTAGVRDQGPGIRSNLGSYPSSILHPPSSILGSQGDDTPLWRTAVLVAMAYVLVGSTWFEPWYLLLPLAPAALLPASTFTRVVLPCYCLGALWSNLTSDFLLFLPSPGLSPTEVSWLSVITQLTPLLCAVLLPLLWRAARQRRRAERKPLYPAMRRGKAD